MRVVIATSNPWTLADDAVRFNTNRVTSTQVEEYSSLPQSISLDLGMRHLQYEFQVETQYPSQRSDPKLGRRTTAMPWSKRNWREADTSLCAPGNFEGLRDSPQDPKAALSSAHARLRWRYFRGSKEFGFSVLSLPSYLKPNLANLRLYLKYRKKGRFLACQCISFWNNSSYRLTDCLITNRCVLNMPIEQCVPNAFPFHIRFDEN